MATATATFGEGLIVIDATAHFDGERWHATGQGLSDEYLSANGLTDVTAVEYWADRYESSGHLLGLYRDAGGEYWELRLNEADAAQRLHYVGDRLAALRLAAQYEVRVWDGRCSTSWLVVGGAAHELSCGGVPRSVMQSATDALDEAQPATPAAQQAAVLAAWAEGYDGDPVNLRCVVTELKS